MNNNKEIRMLNVRSYTEDDSKEMILEGYAVVFDTPQTQGEYTEIIDRHAFDNCDMSDVCLKYNHSDVNYILARTRNHSLELIKDDMGLKIRAHLIPTTTNKDAYLMVQSELIDKMSFAFTVRKYEDDFDTNTRKILDIDKLYDVAIVDVPFYDATEVHARDLENAMKEFEERKSQHESLQLAKAKAKMKLSLN